MCFICIKYAFGCMKLRQLHQRMTSGVIPSSFLPRFRDMIFSTYTVYREYLTLYHLFYLVDYLSDH